MTWTREALELIEGRVMGHLAGTQYECSRLWAVSAKPSDEGDDSVCFAYRGVLVSPISSFGEDPKTVIVKHTEDAPAVGPAVAPDIEVGVSRCLPRCFAEASMLEALGGLSFRTPFLLFFDRHNKTQVHQDLLGATLHHVIPRLVDRPLEESVATSIGRDLGSWLRSFHNWSDEPAQSHLRAEIRRNQPVLPFRLWSDYNCFIETLDGFTGLIGEYRKTLEEVTAMAEDDFARQPSDEEDPTWGLIHGDFRTEHALMTVMPSSGTPNMFALIGWQNAQYGHRAYDVGQMIRDLCWMSHAQRMCYPLWIIEGFVNGYGGVSEDLAYRTAIHAGVHFISSYRHEQAKIEPLARLVNVPLSMKLGMDMVCKGWARDKEWFMTTDLAPLFGGQVVQWLNADTMVQR